MSLDDEIDKERRKLEAARKREDVRGERFHERKLAALESARTSARFVGPGPNYMKER